LARLVVTTEPKLASLLRAAASSLRVSNAAGALLMRVVILLPTRVLQKLVVAAVLSLLRSSTAGRVTVPVKVGLLIGA